MYKNRLILSSAEKRELELEELRIKFDLALAIRNKELFMEWTDQLKEYEV